MFASTTAQAVCLEQPGLGLRHIEYLIIGSGFSRRVLKKELYITEENNVQQDVFTFVKAMKD